MTIAISKSISKTDISRRTLMVGAAGIWLLV